MLIQSKTQGVIDPPDVERDSGMVFTPLKRDSKTSLKIPPQQFLDRYMTLLMESFDSVNRDMFWTPSELAKRFRGMRSALEYRVKSLDLARRMILWAFQQRLDAGRLSYADRPPVDARSLRDPRSGQKSIPPARLNIYADILLRHIDAINPVESSTGAAEYRQRALFLAIRVLIKQFNLLARWTTVTCNSSTYMAQLPDELQVNILERTLGPPILDEDPTENDIERFQSRLIRLNELRRVSRGWRGMIDGAGLLWRKVSSEDPPALVSRALRLSRGEPLQVYLGRPLVTILRFHPTTDTATYSRKFLDLISENLGRFETIHIAGDSTAFYKLITERPAVQLKYLHLGHVEEICLPDTIWTPSKVLGGLTLSLREASLHYPVLCRSTELVALRRLELCTNHPISISYIAELLKSVVQLESLTLDLGPPRDVDETAWKDLAEGYFILPDLTQLHVKATVLGSWTALVKLMVAIHAPVCKDFALDMLFPYAGLTFVSSDGWDVVRIMDQYMTQVIKSVPLGELSSTSIEVEWPSETIILSWAGHPKSRFAVQAITQDTTHIQLVLLFLSALQKYKIKPSLLLTVRNVERPPTSDMLQLIATRIGFCNGLRLVSSAGGVVTHWWRFLSQPLQLKDEGYIWPLSGLKTIEVFDSDVDYNELLYMLRARSGHVTSYVSPLGSETLRPPVPFTHILMKGVKSTAGGRLPLAEIVDVVGRNVMQISA